MESNPFIEIEDADKNYTNNNLNAGLKVQRKA